MYPKLIGNKSCLGKSLDFILSCTLKPGMFLLV